MCESVLVMAGVVRWFVNRVLDGCGLGQIV